MWRMVLLRWTLGKICKRSRSSKVHQWRVYHTKGISAVTLRLRSGEAVIITIKFEIKKNSCKRSYQKKIIDTSKKFKKNICTS